MLLPLARARCAARRARAGAGSSSSCSGVLSTTRGFNQWAPTTRPAPPGGSDAGRGPQRIDPVGALPRELGELAAEVAVRRGPRVDRAEQVEVADDRSGSK